MNKANILILGIAYKSDIDDYRESLALKVIENFQKQGSAVCFYDPYISSYRYKGKEYDGVDLTQKTLNNAELVVITTAQKSMITILFKKTLKLYFIQEMQPRTLRIKAILNYYKRV